MDRRALRGEGAIEEVVRGLTDYGVISSESGFSVFRRIGTIASITPNLPPLPRSCSKPSAPSPLSLPLPLSPPLHFPPRRSQRRPLLRDQSAFLSTVEGQRLHPGSLFPPLRNLHRALVFTLRELGGGRSSVKSTSVLDLALARRARPEFGGEGLSVVLVTERLAGFPFPALSFPPYPLLLATLQLLLHRGNS